MLFNSFEFAFFLPVVFLLYWFVVHKNFKVQNVLLLAASYFFYGWWDWRFLSLIIFSSFVDYTIGLKIGQSTDQKYRKRVLLLSIFTNLGFLWYFKYCNFFIDSFVEAFSFFGMNFEATRLDIILPVGISFYTFQTLSYSIDIYKEKFKPVKDIVAFFTFVSFFPQLVAGPIERAADLLPQFLKERKFEKDKAIDGMRQILWGFYKKVVIADYCSYYVNDIFGHYQNYSAPTLILGGFYFTIQLYADFSGYSDIAIGTARLFGFNLKQNFAFPFFSKNITEFWRRWHISLSSWFRDYLFSPLAFEWRNHGINGTLAALLVSFTIIGFWHGAGWNFILFGFLHALALIYDIKTKKIRKKLRKRWPKIPYKIMSVALTFTFWVFTCIVFRSENFGHLAGYMTQMFSTLEIAVPHHIRPKLGLNILILFLVEWWQRKEQHGLSFDNLKIPQSVRWTIYFMLTVSMVRELSINFQQTFVYFQF